MSLRVVVRNLAMREQEILLSTSDVHRIIYDYDYLEIHQANGDVLRVNWSAPVAPAPWGRK